MELSEFLALPYPRILTRDDDGRFIATIAELPGCTADGATEAEALANLKDIQTMWGEAALKDRRDIPRPIRADELPSGKWVQRVPKTLHAQLAQAAREEGTSLNLLVNDLLSQGLALRTAWRNPPAKMVKLAIQNHAWQRQEAQHLGEYAYTPEAQTNATAIEVLRRSQPARLIPIERYRSGKK